LFYVRHGGRYYDYSGVSGLDFQDDSRAFAATDFDGDGNLDLCLKSRLGPQIRCLQNNSTEGRLSISFRLRGIRSNADAIGAAVELHWGGQKTRKFVQAGTGYLCQHTKTLYFGLGTERFADKAVILWPSGEKQTFDDLEAGFRYEISEGSEVATKSRHLAHEPMKATPVPGDNTVRFEPVWLLEPVPVPDTRKGPGFLLLTDRTDISLPAAVPIEVLNLREAPAALAGSYATFRRFLFDWRPELTLPTLLLLDGNGKANKLYPAVPDEKVLLQDLQHLTLTDRRTLALPFGGRAVTEPARNHYKLGAAFVAAGFPKHALAYLSTAIDQSPENFKAWLAIGQVDLELQNYERAAASLKRALALNAGSPEVWNNLGGVELAAGRYNEALRCFEKMLELAPDSLYGLTNAALAMTKMKRTSDAERLYRKAVELHPSDADTIDRLGLLVAQSGRVGESIELFKRALALDSRNISVINNLGVAYLHAGQRDDAIAAFRYGFEVAPANDMIALNLARLYVASGRRDQAVQVLQEFLMRVPGHLSMTRALAQLGVQ
jgi:tetratricopeptide (TPR) repeat protein